MTDETGPDPVRSLETFVEGRTDAPDDWRWLWEGDVEFPVQSRPGLLGRVIVACKRALRPWVRSPQADLWERQRVFNMVMVRALEHLSNLQRQGDDLHRDLNEVRADLLKDVKQHAGRLDHLEEFKRDGLGDFATQSDALFARLDQKLDRYRRESRELAREVERLVGGSNRTESD